MEKSGGSTDHNSQNGGKILVGHHNKLPVAMGDSQDENNLLSPPSPFF